tara:strand:- start:16 stop:375 length:360 start_codon:yes stop_codon:yes gene_type:complete
MHSLSIKNLAIDTTIGVYEHEKTITQRLYLSLIFDYDFSCAMKSDALNDTLDYALLGQKLKDVLENNCYELIERVLAVVADILETDYKITRYRIEVSKPSALSKADHVCAIFDNRQPRQ